MGPIVLVSRPAAEPRLPDDPEWPGRTDLELAWRMVEAYGSAQFKYGSVFYGQMDRNWGPAGSPAFRSATTATSVEAGFDVGIETVRLSERRATVDRRNGFARPQGPPLLLRPSAHGAAEPAAEPGALGDERAGGRRPRIRFPVPEPAFPPLLANHTAWAPTATSCSGRRPVAGLPRADPRRPARARRSPYENTGGNDRYPSRWAFTLAAFGPARQQARLARLLHSSLQPRLSHPESLRELYRRRRGTRPQLCRHGPALRRWPRPGRDPVAPDARAHRAAPGRGRNQRPLSRHPGGSRRDPAALHRRGGAHLPGGAGRAAAGRARSISVPVPACITSSMPTTRRAAP